MHVVVTPHSQYARLRTNLAFPSPDRWRSRTPRIFTKLISELSLFLADWQEWQPSLVGRDAEHEAPAQFG